MRPRRNSSHLLSCLDKPSHLLCNGLSVLAGLAMRSKSAFVQRAGPSASQPRIQTRSPPGIMATMADTSSLTVSVQPCPGRDISLSSVRGKRATSHHHLASEGQGSEINFQCGGTECCVSQVLGTRSNESPRQFDGDPVAAMNDGHHQHMMVRASVLPH